MLQRIALTLLLAASVTATAALRAQDTGSARARSGHMRQHGGGRELPATMSDANIIAHLAASDSLEVQMSQMAQPHLGVEDVREYAQMLVRDHSASLQKGAAAAQSAGITPAPAPGDTAASHMMAMMNRMTGEHGGMHGAMHDMGSMNMTDHMDTMFVRHSMLMHAQVLGQLRTLRGQAQSAVVQQQIDAAIPMVEKHLERSIQLAHKLKVAVDTTGRMDMREMHEMHEMHEMRESHGMRTPAGVVNQVPAPAAARTGLNPAINATNGGMNAGMGSSTSGMNNGTINGTNGANGAGTIGANAVNNGSLGGTAAGAPASRVPPIQPGRVTPPPKRPKVSGDSSAHHPPV